MSELSLWLPIVAGFVAVAYGVITTQRLMALPTGSAKMQEIAKAIQEGASAYLTRQFKTIAVILIILWLLGLVSSYTMGGFIHVLLVIALVAAAREREL